MLIFLQDSMGARWVRDQGVWQWNNTILQRVRGLSAQLVNKFFEQGN